MAKQILFDDAARQKMRDGIEKLAQDRARHPRPGRPQRHPRRSPSARPRSPRTASRSPRRSSSTTPSRTWAPSSCARSPARPTTSPVTARRPPPCWPRRSSREGLKYLATGVNTIALRNGIDKAVEAAVESIARPVAQGQEPRGEAPRSRTISANNDPEIGELLAEAFEKVGDDGVITVEEAKGIETELEVVEGMEFDKGYISPYFVTDLTKLMAELEDCLRSSSTRRRSRTCATSCRCSSSAAQTGQAAPDHRRGHRGRGAGRRWSSTASRACSTSAPSRRRASATAARPSWTTSPS